MKTVTIQIGNSDNKLPQNVWADFIEYTAKVCRPTLQHPQVHTHFEGGSSYDKKWQNSCWVLVCPDDYINVLRTHLGKAAAKFNQDSIAMSVADSTEFVEAITPELSGDNKVYLMGGRFS